MGNLATVVRLGVALIPYLVDYVWAQQDVVRGKFEPSFTLTNNTNDVPVRLSIPQRVRHFAL